MKRRGRHEKKSGEAHEVVRRGEERYSSQKNSSSVRGVGMAKLAK